MSGGVRGRYWNDCVGPICSEAIGNGSHCVLSDPVMDISPWVAAIDTALCPEIRMLKVLLTLLDHVD